MNVLQQYVWIMNVIQIVQLKDKFLDNMQMDVIAQQMQNALIIIVLKTQMVIKLVHHHVLKLLH